ncbi:MAG: ABC transporter ATP-binding protein [Candidatus Methanofastidiosia archaeon]
MIKVIDLWKIYERGSEMIKALKGIDLEIPKGNFVTVMGPSGCGKSTLLHILGGIDTPTKGKILINGKNIGEMKDNELTEFRKKNIGFVFQFYNLIPTLNAFENVELPLIALNVPKNERRKRVEEILGVVGLEERMYHLPSELSGGEQQRVAIARAMVAKPRLVLADEPTGDLDSKSSRKIVDLMLKLNRELLQTFVVVTHDLSVGERGNMKIHLKDGVVV